MAEKVDHPKHYGGDVPHEVYKCLEAWGLVRNAYLWNAAKYIGRSGRKKGEDPVVGLKKAAWYLDREIKRLELEKVLKRAGPKFREVWAEIELVRNRIARGCCGRCGRRKCRPGCEKLVKPKKKERARHG